jgi:hypothetical protein
VAVAVRRVIVGVVARVAGGWRRDALCMPLVGFIYGFDTGMTLPAIPRASYLIPIPKLWKAYCNLYIEAIVILFEKKCGHLRNPVTQTIFLRFLKRYKMRIPRNPGFRGIITVYSWL